MHGRWINPIGGLGDTLMISGVLKLFAERYPAQKLNLVERTKYRHLLEGHPAIDRIGNPPEGASFISTNYWAHDDYRLRGERAYQVLARIFGLDPPVEERLYVPWEMADDARLMGVVPWERSNVLVCQSSNSPRKQMGTTNWEWLVERLKARGLGVVQAGRAGDSYVRGAYSLLGLTTPRQTDFPSAPFRCRRDGRQFPHARGSFVRSAGGRPVGADRSSRLWLCRTDPFAGPSAV